MSSPSVCPTSRPLDGLEKAFWLLDQNRPTHFVMAAEMVGTPTVDAWRRCLGETGRRLPQLARKIVSTGGVPSFVRIPPRGIPLLAIAGGVNDWAHHVEVELANPFDPQSDALVRARLLHEGDRAVLLLVLHHSIADGASAVWLLRDILQAVAGVPVFHSADVRSLEEAVDEAGWEKTAIADLFTDGTRAPPGYRPADLKNPSFVTRVLSQASVDMLRDRSRREQTTLHGALAAAASRAFAAIFPPQPWPPRVFSPIDARRRLLDGAQHLGVHLNALTVRLDTLAPDFWADARKYAAALGRFNDTRVLAGGIQAVRDAVAAIDSPAAMAEGWAVVFGGEILLTNLGDLSLAPVFGHIGVKAVWGPAVATGIDAEQTMSALGFGGRLHLAHTSFQPLPGFLDAVATILDTAVEG